MHIKSLFILFLSLTPIFPVNAALEQRALTINIFIKELNESKEDFYVKTMFDLCEGRIIIEPEAIFDCAGIIISAHNEYDDFSEILSGLPKQKLFDLTARTDKKGRSLLHLLVSNEKIDYLKALLEFPINVDTIDNAGNTPLHLAAAKQNFAIVNLLFQHGASEKIKNNNGVTPEDLLIGDYFTIKRLQNQQANAANATLYDSWIQDILRSPLAIAHGVNAHLNGLERKCFADMYYADENQIEDDLEESIQGY